MEKVFESVKKRYSVRTYDTRPVEGDKIKKLQEFLEGNNMGPFGNKVRFQIVDLGDNAASEIKKFISYGSVTGARLFIDGAVEKGEKAMEDYGYAMEKNVLFATALGLGTVWIGGTLKRNLFADKINLTEKELLPAITPVGYAADKRSLTDKIFRTVSGGKNRKNYSSLFFHGDLTTPLLNEDCGEYANAIYAVRVGPSANNAQPWRIIKEKNKEIFHFYLNEGKSNNMLKDIKIQNNDLGIAMCHFELVARENGLDGQWKVEKPVVNAGELVYVVSWMGNAANV